MWSFSLFLVPTVCSFHRDGKLKTALQLDVGGFLELVYRTNDVSGIGRNYCL